MTNNVVVEVTMSSFSKVPNVRVPWTLKKESSIIPLERALKKYHEILPVFERSTEDPSMPSKSKAHNRLVEGVMYELHNIADEQYSLWETFQLSLTNKRTGIVNCLKFIRTDIEHLGKQLMSNRPGFKTTLDDLWTSPNHCLIVRTMEPV